MSADPWALLDDELALWGQAGRTATLWWRDDDTQTATPELVRLDALSRSYQVPLVLAVIPLGADASLIPLLNNNPLLIAWQHGYSHQNHAAAGERKCELGSARSQAAVLAELVRGRQQLSELLGPRFCPVLVPPWNRLAESLVKTLSEAGWVGLSTLGPRRRDGIAELNVHVDLIDWRAGRVFAGDANVIAQLLTHLRARRLGEVDAAEATGIMSHHLAHDDGCWDFLQRLLAWTSVNPHCRWVDPGLAF